MDKKVSINRKKAEEFIRRDLNRSLNLGANLKLDDRGLNLIQRLILPRNFRELIHVMVTIVPTYLGSDEKEIEVYEAEVVWPTLNTINDAT
jgi:hypothetical protein